MSPLSSGSKNMPNKKLASKALLTTFRAGFSLGLFDLEDGDEFFFRNVG
jgi:hypothetical protein